jgi:hypothetical protein
MMTYKSIEEFKSANLRWWTTQGEPGPETSVIDSREYSRSKILQENPDIADILKDLNRRVVTTNAQQGRLDILTRQRAQVDFLIESALAWRVYQSLAQQPGLLVTLLDSDGNLQTNEFTSREASSQPYELCIPICVRQGLNGDRWASCMVFSLQSACFRKHLEKLDPSLHNQLCMIWVCSYKWGESLAPFETLADILQQVMP